jgi:opacity protein-like surface antigen
MFKQFAAIASVAAMMTMTAFAQEDYTRYKSDATVLGVGAFVKQTTQDGVRQSADNTGGVLATYRYWFDRHNGAEANYAWTQTTDKYNELGIKNNSNEVSAAYVYRMPLRRWSPFVLAGAGGLIFDPKNYSGASTQARAAFVYGGGADFNLTDHFYIRGEYRGLVYNSPTFGETNLYGMDRVTHRAEPTLGFGWRF